MLAALLLVATLVNPAMTPGVVRPLSRTAVCQTAWGRDHRHVTTAMKREVATRYGVPWDERANYEFDHLIPRELGGADDVLNLWPQAWTDAKRKDRLENRLHVLVCNRTLSLRQAQTVIRSDWQQAYRDYVEKP